MGFLAFCLRLAHFICTFKGHFFLEHRECTLLEQWCSETVTLALLSFQKLRKILQISLLWSC